MKIIMLKLLFIISVLAISFGTYIIGLGVYALTLKIKMVSVCIALIIGGATTICVYIYIIKLVKSVLKDLKK